MARKQRPTSRTIETEAIILARLAAGETLRGICKSPGMPSHPTVLEWVSSDAVFADRYTHARRSGLDVIAEQIVELADVCRKGVKTEEKHVGWLCTACKAEVQWLGDRWKHGNFATGYTPMCLGAGKPERIVETKTVTTDMVERAKLQIDARKWLLSKLRPDKYGDRTSMELTGKDGGPVESRHEIVFVKPKPDAS